MDRITVNPRQMGGVPCIRGLRIPLATVVAMIDDGMTPDEIVAELPPLDLDDVSAALRFAADAVADREIPLQSPREVPRRPEPLTASCSTAPPSWPLHCHILERGLEHADDDVLLDVARDERRIVISGDTGFGALLALTRQKSPSVILFRSRHHRTAEQVPRSPSAQPDEATFTCRREIVVKIRLERCWLSRPHLVARGQGGTAAQRTTGGDLRSACNSRSPTFPLLTTKPACISLQFPQRPRPRRQSQGMRRCRSCAG